MQARRKQKQENQKFTGILSYIVKLRLAWAICDLCCPFLPPPTPSPNLHFPDVETGTERLSSWVRPEFESRESGSTVHDPNQCATLLHPHKCFYEELLIGENSSRKGICVLVV